MSDDRGPASHKRTRAPATREGLAELVLSIMKNGDSTYFIFCKELEKGGGDQKAMKDYCENLCQVHKNARTNQLFCFPYSVKRLL